MFQTHKHWEEFVQKLSSLCEDLPPNNSVKTDLLNFKTSLNSSFDIENPNFQTLRDQLNTITMSLPPEKRIELEALEELDTLFKIAQEISTNTNYSEM